MKQTGELLRQARENAKLSLSEVALSTKINPKILTAIENGDTAHLPAKTFLKGFIRSYAVYLKMDPEEVIRSFNAETSSTPSGPITPAAETARPTEEPPTPAAPPAPQRHRRVGDEESFSGFRAMAVAVIVILIGLIIGTRELIEKYQREKVTDNPQEIKVSPLAEPPPSTVAEPPVETKTAPDSTDKPDTKPAQAEPEPVTTEPPKPVGAPEVKPPEVKVAEVSPPPVPAPAPAPVVKPMEVKPAEPAPVPESTSTATGSALKSVKSEIILEALDKVEVKFKVRGKSKVLSLGPTQVHTIFADEPMVLDISDGGAVNIILNGRERGVPGDLGKPKQVSIP